MLTGLLSSDVLFTFWSPTLEALIPLAILSSVTAAAAIFEVVIAAAAITGLWAVPAKSPASCRTPLVDKLASLIFTFELLLFDAFITITESTYCFTAFTEGYFVSELASSISMVLLLSSDSLLLIRTDNKIVSIEFNFLLILVDKEAVSIKSFRFA